MFRTKKNIENLSPGTITWRKLLGNTTAMVALGWILLNILLSVLGYLITPDSTPFANMQHLELAAKKPGTQITFLRVKKNTRVSESNIFKTMINGKESRYVYYPIQSYSFAPGEITATKYTGSEEFEGIEMTFKLIDVVYALDPSFMEADLQPATSLHGEMIETNQNVLEQIIISNHLKRKRFLLGTDRFGRDMLSQVIIGARVSMSVGFIAINIALILGLILGSLAGFFRGRTDSIILWFINVVWSIPTLLLVIAITFALGKGFWQIFIAVGLTMWVDVARLVRGQIISLRENEYIEAAKALGLPSIRIIRRHLFLNMIGPVVVISAANFASAILIEAGLSFLGIGVQPPMPSWGSMIRENYGFIILDKAYLAVIPGICISMLVMAFMLLGNGLRDSLDRSSGGF